MVSMQSDSEYSRQYKHFDRSNTIYHPARPSPHKEMRYGIEDPKYVHSITPSSPNRSQYMPTPNSTMQPRSRQDSAPGSYGPFMEIGRDNDPYYRRYLDLTRNIAYKYPNVGTPREKSGRQGGTWRHIKEVQGYSGRVVFVDGLVKLYDHNFKSDSGNKDLPLPEPQQSFPSYAPSRYDIDSQMKSQQRVLEQGAYKPWMNAKDFEMPSINDTQRRNFEKPASSNRHRGFYSYNTIKQDANWASK